MPPCTLCPRQCNIDRNLQKGFCSCSSDLLVARAALHEWEEPCISLGAGTGAVFFSGCPLKCVFCQNEAISRGKAGAVISPQRLYEIFFELKAQGAQSISLITATHFADTIAPVLQKAKRDGLALPIIYNTSGYETVETLRLLEGLIDIYLPDFKYMSSKLSARYSNAGDYPQVAKAALDEMVRQRPFPCFSGEKLMRGVIVRHLVLPSHIEDSKAVLRYLIDSYADDIAISIMRQYTPPEGIEKQFPELARKVSDEEYCEICAYALELGLNLGYTQEAQSALESFIPQFDLFGVIKQR